MSDSVWGGCAGGVEACQRGMGSRGEKGGREGLLDDKLQPMLLGRIVLLGVKHSDQTHGKHPDYVLEHGTWELVTYC